MNVFTDKEYSKKFMGKLPEKIQERLTVLLGYHEEYKKLEDSFDDQEMAIRAKYEKEFTPLFERRKQIVTGESQPTEEEVNGGFPEDHKDKVSLTEGEASDEAGLGEFWMTVLENHCIIADLIQPDDALILKHLVDISSRTIPGKRESFEVVFTFAPNEYLEETSLTFSVVTSEEETNIKKSPMTFKKDHADFLWETVTVKKPGKKAGGAAKKVRKPKESFFWIFEEMDEDIKDDLDDVMLEEEQLLNLLHTLHRKVIPCAVNFFTREMDGASDLDDDEYDEEDEEDDEDDM